MSDGGAATDNILSANNAGESIKSSLIEEDKQADLPAKEAAPILPPGFKGIFSLKSKNQSAKERFN